MDSVQTATCITEVNSRAQVLLKIIGPNTTALEKMLDIGKRRISTQMFPEIVKEVANIGPRVVFRSFRGGCCNSSATNMVGKNYKQKLQGEVVVKQGNQNGVAVLFIENQRTFADLENVRARRAIVANNPVTRAIKHKVPNA